MKTTFVSSLAVVAVAMMTITAQAAALPTAALPTPTIVGSPSATLSGSDRIPSSSANNPGGSRAYNDDSRYIHLNADGDALLNFNSGQKQSSSSSQHKSGQSQGSEVPKPKDESKKTEKDEFRDFFLSDTPH